LVFFIVDFDAVREAAKIVVLPELARVSCVPNVPCQGHRTTRGMGKPQR